jgi:hypothetical protein
LAICAPHLDETKPEKLSDLATRFAYADAISARND